MTNLTAAQLRARLEAIDFEADADAIEKADAAYRRALLGDDHQAIAKASGNLSRAKSHASQREELAQELEAAIARAEANEAAAKFEGQADEMRRLQRRGLALGVEIHDTAERLVDMLAEFSTIDVRLNAHNTAAARRRDLVVAPPFELLSVHLGVSAITLPDPRQWTLAGYWPVGDMTAGVDPRHRIGRMRELLPALDAAEQPADSAS